MSDDGSRGGGGWLPVPSGDDSSPEKQELDAKRDELRRLNEEVVSREMKLETLRAQVEGFACEKLFRLGRLYARIDELKLLIAEAMLARSREDPVLQRRVQEARAQAARSDEAAVDAEERGPPQRVALTREHKHLYREAACRMHPDLGRTPEDRERRHDYMVRLNAAYTSGDIEGIQDVMAAWEAQSEPDEDTDVAQDLIRVIRAIARHRRTRERIEREIAEIRTRSDHVLMVRVYRALEQGQDLIGEMEQRLHDRIADLEARLRDLEEGAEA